MTWRTEKTRTGEDLVWSGVETGIAPSPHKGTANIQNANIATETGEVMASFGRVSQTPTAINNGTLTPNGATDFTGPSTLSAGQWISVSASTVSSISTTTSPTTAAISYLIVGGGGGGGGAFAGTAGGGGGGGAGEFISSTTNLAVGSFPVVVGTGGAGGGNAIGSNGTDSSISTVDTAVGGGGGGFGNSSGTLTGQNGASGGGGAGADGAQGNGGSATAGNAGGNGRSSSTESGGGGGGSSAVGANGTSANGGAGGAGTASSISGTSVTYAGGGGGGSQFGGTGAGGGGNGGNYTAGSAGTANTGGGGGGGADNNSSTGSGGAGGSGVVIISYPVGSMLAVGGYVTLAGGNVIHTFTESGVFNILSINQTNLYYVSYKSGTTYRLSSKFDPTGANALTHGTTGSVTFSTVAVPNQALAKATEKYTTASAVEYRYYILDANSYVWVFDTLINGTYGTQWMLPDPNSYSTLRLTGIGVLSGLLTCVGKGFVVGKPNNDLGRTFLALGDVYLNEPFPTHNNFALVGSQGKMYYCDGNYIGEVFPTTSLVTSIANIQSQCSYTAATTTGTVSAIVSGSLPYSPDGTRIPAVFYTDVYGTQPTNLAQSTVYYIECNPTNASFGVYAAITGGSAIDIASGAAGNQFFTTYWPYGEGGVAGDNPLVQVSTQRVNLPANETAQCMVEIGNTVLIGGITNIIYPWNQVDATPSDLIVLPESNVKTMVNANNTAYVFAGNKGNVYVTNNSVAALAGKIPDYAAGVPGTPLTYIEPRFTWGDSMYTRGRIYCSILDQTSTKAGNCGGVWSFIPSQNVDPNQALGMALRLENQNSYGNYSGYATILIPSEEQDAISPQYWSSWQTSYSTGTSTFGIDYTNTVPVVTYVIETDILPSGTNLEKTTFSQIEYKMASPLATGDSVQLYYRLNATDAWATCGTVKEELTNRISGYFNQTFQKTQWTQLRAVVTTTGTTASSFGRLTELRIR